LRLNETKISYPNIRVRRSQLRILKREFEILQIREGEKVDECFAWTLTIVNKMKIYCVKMTSVVSIEKI